MKNIVLYKNREEALKSLDNGGHFFNLFTKANDGVVTEAELGKVAGLLDDTQQLIIF